MNPPLVDPKDVALYLLEKANVAGEPVTNLKLQKLLYYACGHTLEYTGEKLFAENIEAWQFGPVVRSVYGRYADHERVPIVTADQPELGGFPPEIIAILDAVCNKYMPVSPWTLMEKTHKEMPWRKAYREGGKYPLSDADMKEQFSCRTANLRTLTDADMLAPGDSLNIGEETIDGEMLMGELLGKPV